MVQRQARVHLENMLMSKARFRNGMPTLHKGTLLYKNSWQSISFRCAYKIRQITPFRFLVEEKKEKNMNCNCWYFGAFAASMLLYTAMTSECKAQIPVPKSALSPNWGKAVNNLQFRAVPVKPDFAVDEPVLITLEVKTTGSQPLGYGDNRLPYKAFKIALTDAAGHPVPLTRYGKIVAETGNFDPRFSFANRTIEVRPGYKVIYHFWINRMYDMTVPGDYHITFSRSNMATGNTISKDTIISNTAVIKIVESKNFDTPETNLDLPSGQPL